MRVEIAEDSLAGAPADVRWLTMRYAVGTADGHRVPVLIQPFRFPWPNEGVDENHAAVSVGLFTPYWRTYFFEMTPGKYLDMRYFREKIAPDFAADSSITLLALATVRYALGRITDDDPEDIDYT